MACFSKPCIENLVIVRQTVRERKTELNKNLQRSLVGHSRHDDAMYVGQMLDVDKKLLKGDDIWNLIFVLTSKEQK